MAIVPQPFKIHSLPEFSMGLNNALSPDEIMDNEMADCENFEIDEFHAKTAAGYVGWDNNPQAGPFWGIYQFKKSDGTQTLIRQRQGILEYDSDDAGTWVACTLPTTGSPAHSITLPQNQPTFVTLNDTVLYSDGSTYVLSSTDGITWTNRTGTPPSGLPAGILMNNGKNRVLFLIKNTSEIWWSEINTPLSVLSTSWQFINPNDGEKIVGGCLTPQGSTYIFKEKMIYEVDDITLGMVAVNQIGEGYPTNHHSIAVTNDSVLFVSMDSCVKQIIGGSIRNITGRITPVGRNSITNVNLITAVYSFNKYRVSMPDKIYDETEAYNAQEYIVYLNMQRNDPVQPYPITRNRRFIGCYGMELYDDGSYRSIVCYIGDSRSTIGGSPAVNYAEFAYINEIRDPGAVQGLDGSSQSCYLVTKYFTEKIPYHVKKYKKLFYQLNIQQDTSVIISYRFDPYDSWTDIINNVSLPDIQITYDDGDYGDFDEGFGFAGQGIVKNFIPLENTEKPRGIQFKISVDTTNDITELNLAYQFLAKTKFR